METQDYSRHIHDNWLLWGWTIAVLWLAGLLALALAAAGTSAYLMQTLAERRHEIALRYALGALALEIWFWMTRQVRPALVAGLAVSGALSALVLWMSGGMTPERGFAYWLAGAVAVLVLATLWSAASWVVSWKAGAEALMERLRHI